MGSLPEPSLWIQASWRGEQSFQQVCDLVQKDLKKDYMAVVGLFVVYGSWNLPPLPPPSAVTPTTGKSRNNADLPTEASLYSGLQLMLDALLHPHARLDTQYRTGIVQVDRCEEELEVCCGDNHLSDHGHDSSVLLPCPPELLPVLLLVLRRSSMKTPQVRYLDNSILSSKTILDHWRKKQRNDGSDLLDFSKKEVQNYLENFGLLPTKITVSPTIRLEQAGPSSSSSAISTITTSNKLALRIFVAGDRMSVGKTSVCLGLLGNLVRMGYPTEWLAYIKPATQNENPQLVQHYCELLGIDCIPIGPIVYYRGFTRAYLAGETETSAELLIKVENAVDKLASKGKRVVIVDGVGFPAVGSICGTDNALVAKASGYPSQDKQQPRRPLGVVLVGGSGVGGAVDAFNLNATYFERAHVPVLGAIFNKLSLEGFYSLENCRTQVSAYFAQNEHQLKLGRQAFGFVPLFPKLTEGAMDHVFEFIQLFGQYVDMDAILQAATRVQDESIPMDMEIDDGENAVISTTTAAETASCIVPSSRPNKRIKSTDDGNYDNNYKNNKRTLSREEIENAAIQGGAAPSA